MVEKYLQEVRTTEYQTMTTRTWKVGRSSKVDQTSCTSHRRPSSNMVPHQDVRHASKWNDEVMRLGDWDTIIMRLADKGFSQKWQLTQNTKH